MRNGERSDFSLETGERGAVLPSGAVSSSGTPSLDEERDRSDFASEGDFFLEGATAGSYSGGWGAKEREGSLGRTHVSRLLFRAWPLLRPRAGPRCARRSRDRELSAAGERVRLRTSLSAFFPLLVHIFRGAFTNWY